MLLRKINICIVLYNICDVLNVPRVCTDRSKMSKGTQGQGQGHKEEFANKKKEMNREGREDIIFPFYFLLVV